MQQTIVLAALLASSVAALPWGPDGNWGPPGDQNSAWPESGSWPSMTWTGRPEWAGPSASETPSVAPTPDTVSAAAPTATSSPVFSDDSDVSHPATGKTADLSDFSTPATKPSMSLYKPSGSFKPTGSLKPTGLIKSTGGLKPTGSKPTSATAKNQVAPKPTLTRPTAPLGTAPAHISKTSKQDTTSTSAISTSPTSTLATSTSEISTSATSAKPSSSGTASTGSAYSDMVLAHHNVHRANHSADALKWDSNLASTAETIARSCKFAHDTVTDKSMYPSGYGQNIQAGTAAADVWEAITNSFYNGEVNAFAGDYGQANPSSNFENWGHFSQVVWKSTTAVGCATVHCPNGVADGAGTKDFTVCNYTPPGNYGGEYAKNIGKPLNQPTVNKAQVGAY